MIIGNARAEELGVHVERLAYLDRFLAKAAEGKTSPSIAICVAHKGVEIFNGAYGVAAPGGPQLQLDAITDVASVTKPFTATMAMMMQEDGLLDIVDPLQKYYPEFMGTDKEGVSLCSIMTHSSGMSDQLANQYIRDYLAKSLHIRVPQDDAPWEEWEEAGIKAMRMFGYAGGDAKGESVDGFFDWLRLSAPLAHKPGAHFEYCNHGYRILMKIIETVSGQSADSLARRRIFEPLGMTDSHFVLPKEKWPRVLLREESCRGGTWYNSDKCKVEYVGSSGLKTTVRDLLKFGLMFYSMGSLGGARVLSSASVKAMTADYNQAIPPSFWRGRRYGSNWGLGWNVRNGKQDDLGVLRSNSAYDHAGYGGARLLVDPEWDLVAALYMVDQLNDDYILHAKTANIIYSALD